MSTPLGLLFLLSEKGSASRKAEESDISFRERAAACELVAAHNREMKLRQRIQELEDQIGVWEKVAAQFARSKTDSRFFEMMAETRALVQDLRDERRAQRKQRPLLTESTSEEIVKLPQREWVTAKEVMLAFKVSRRTVGHWIAEGRVQLAPSPGQAVRIVRESLLREAS